MASSRSAPLFFLLALLLVAQASADNAPEEPMLDPKCQPIRQMCTLDSCTDLCLNIGLGAYQGFCSFRVNDMQMYCCCPIPAETPPPRH
ncbi:unnamed protein product [Alopecurus aequalis]